MNSVPEAVTFVPTADVIACRECGQANACQEAYCAACGAALESESPTPPLATLAVGAVVDNSYIVDTVESLGRENRYLARMVDRAEYGVVLRERADTDKDYFLTLLEQTKSLSHPSLLLPERLVEQDERCYLVCPRIPGIWLSERIGRTGEREIVSWGVQLCQTLTFIYRQGFRFRELIPENTLLDKEGRLRIAHLDAALIADPTEEYPSVADGYAAPEVYKHSDVGEEAGVFAVGALLYTMLVGKRLPVEGWLVHYEPPVFYPEKIVSPGLERILRKALAFESTDRYATLNDLKAALLMHGHGRRSRSACLTDVGQHREHNEDAVLIKEQHVATVAGDTFAGLYIVSDGMGGAAAGEVASALTIGTIARHIETAQTEGDSQNDAVWEEHLRSALEAANSEILAYAKAHPESAGLGATVVAAVLHGQQVSLAWVGDSRIYLWENGRLQQLSRDHSLVARLVEIGQLAPEEARNHEHRNVLIRSLGSKEHVVVDVLSRPLRRGSRLLLCSDGLTSHVEDHSIADILSRHRDPADAAAELVVAANADGGSDNISVVIVFHE
ncbi:MAG: Stp1/IreP family PP2C-type Ser/Thr phosphatase [Candidatus Binatia bacterium]